MKIKTLISLTLISSIWIGLWAPFVGAQNQNSISKSQNDNQPDEKGLQFRLREAAPPAEKHEAPAPVAAGNLTVSEANEIFRRLPEIKFEDTDRTDFNFRQSSLPPPKTGQTTAVKFPADGQSEVPNAGTADSAKLEVLRFSPQGSVPLVSDLSITFSQPMIAVTSQTEASENVPVSLSPKIRGRWRWLGTKTLIFDAEERFPMATDFTATIPAGTRSAIGGVLEKDVRWNFSTPPAKVEKFAQFNSTVRRDVVLLASFDQDIDPPAVLAKTSAVANGQKIALRLATEAEITADEKLSEISKQLPPQRRLAFRAIDPLPADSVITVVFGAGIPSAEGNLTTVEAQNFMFRTYSKLKFVKSYCGYDGNNDGCQSYENLNIAFNNPLDEKSFDQSQIKIEPHVENIEVSVSGNEIEISGSFKPRATYKVTVDGSLKDDFGQMLEKKISTIFKTDAIEPQLSRDGNDFVVLDPNGKREFSINSINYKKLSVKLYAVNAEDYPAFTSLQKKDFNDLPTFGKMIYDKILKVDAGPDTYAETRIDLSPALKDGLGHAILIAEPTADNRRDNDQRIVVWLEATNIGIDAFVDDENLQVFASDLKSGRPLKDVQISLSNGPNETTGENGLADLKLASVAGQEYRLLTARRGADSAVLFNDNYYDNTVGWARKTPGDSLRWFVFNDRNLYRTGENVSIKGYIRKIAGGKLADVGELAGAVNGLSYILQDSQGNDVLRGAAKINEFGAFDFQLRLPENLNLGYQHLKLSADSKLKGSDYTHIFQVQEFRRPEFEVAAAVETPAPFYIGDSATIKTEAKYYAGGALPNAETTWTVTATPAVYTPPNRDDYTFGKFIPWWKYHSQNNYGETTVQHLKGVTDASGKHRLAIDLISQTAARPYTVKAEADVQDVNRQTFAASANLLVHPSELYVGLRTPKIFVGANEKFTVETITTDIDGKAAAGAPVSLIAELKDRRQIKGEWQEVTIDTQTCQLKSAGEPVSCEFIAKQGGVYTIKASVLDRRERRNESELTVWVAGGNVEPGREVEKEEVELIPDKKEYAPNDTAEILINAPFYPAEGTMTLRRGGIIKTERFTLTTASTVLRIPIEEKYLPNVHVQIDLAGASRRILYDDARDAKLPKRPAYAAGELDLSVSTASRKLTVTAAPAAETLAPGDSTAISVAVRDHSGKAVADSEVAVIAVDESVLALTNYKIDDPVGVFYREVSPGVTDYHSRENVLLSMPDDSGIGYGSGNGQGDGMGGGAAFMPSQIVSLSRLQILTSLQRPPSVNASEQIHLRTNFDALAVFSPSVKTDQMGNAVVRVKLPDNLTRYRITAVAVTNSKQFGSGESSFTARQPLMVRPSAPRFMNFGDRLELPVVLQNQTNRQMAVNVAIRAVNADLTSGNGRKVVIPANDRVEVRFPVSAGKAGTARFQIGAVSEKDADAAEFELPVYMPATGEAFATYGTTDQNGAVVQPISAPQDVFPQFGGLEVTTGSTQLQELTDAFLYLQNYPYECSEQISSRILSVAALRDVLQAFETKDLPSKAAIETKMKSDIERLVKLQHSDGGFSFWRSDDESLPFLSVHAAHALARAAQKGYAVPQTNISNVLVYLKNIEAKYPSFYSTDSRRAISAYALYVRDLLGDKDTAKARRLLLDAGIEKLSPESLGWILSVLAGQLDSTAQIEAIEHNLLNRVTETAGAAHFITNYTDGEYVLLSSSRRADGVILEALLKEEGEEEKREDRSRKSEIGNQEPEENPKAETGHQKSETKNSQFEPENRQSQIANRKSQIDLVPKLVRGLLANKTRGRWTNTQENAFILLALDKYFETYEKVTPDFIARVWLGQTFAGEQKFTGRSTGSTLINVPMIYLAQQGAASNLILDKQGPGRLYYRIGIKYAPKNLKLDATDNGFAVTRQYEAVDEAGDVVKNPDGSWTIKAGARVRVRMQMVAPTRRYHVALVDNLPAGLEIINQGLIGSGSVPEDKISDLRRKTIMAGNEYRYNDFIWYNHQNLRDERAEAFTSLLGAGVWNYSYVARATTAGNFIAPPAKAEEMYSPETFGRSGTDLVTVK